MYRVKAILLIAGRGERFAGSLPKQFYPLAGRKVYQWALSALVESELFEEIVVVCAPEHIERLQEEVGSLATLCEGGASRQESSYRGLLACGPQTDIVVIHDGARPFVSQRILQDNVDGAIRFGAVNTCIPSTDTLAYAPQGNVIESIPLRSHYLRGQTPQSFAYPLILEAHEASQGKKPASDDCSLVMELGKPVHVVRGEETNIKITFPTDLVIAQQLLADVLQKGDRSIC